MWQILLAFVVHRLLLLIVAFASINLHLPSTRPASALPEVHGFKEISQTFLTKVGELPEATQLGNLIHSAPASVVHQSQDPFLWLASWAVNPLGLSPVWALLLLSNLFFFFFLCELYSLLNRLVTPDVALSAVVLAILWPASYEMSLGSGFGLTCMLATMVMRHALDTNWLIAGIALGLLGVSGPLALGLLPFLIYTFWYFQRHFAITQGLTRGVFLFLPLLLVYLWQRTTYGSLGGIFEGSALMNLVQAAKQGASSPSWSLSYAGQTISLVLLAVGAVAALFTYSTMMHRLLPLTMWLILLLFSPYGAIASRGLLAGSCLEGLAALCSQPVARLLQFAMIFFAVHDVYGIFGNM